MHLVLINKESYQVEIAKAFDTNKTSKMFELIIQGIPDGYIIAAAGKDDSVTHLSSAAKQWFVNMGS